jgi:hypothetical protein
MPKSRRRKTKASPPTGRFVKMTPATEDALKRQLEVFRKKFGRDPGPGDPVFFDPNSDAPAPMPNITDDVLAAMQAANLPPEFAYAYRKTGLLGLGADKSAWDPEDIEEWNAAVDEGRAIQVAIKRPGRPDQGSWNTDIPELILSPFSKDDLALVRECVAAVAPIEARGMNVVTRIELAAAFVATALEHAYEAGDDTGEIGDGAETFAITEEIILRRAREIYSQGHG